MVQNASYPGSKIFLLIRNDFLKNTKKNRKTYKGVNYQSNKVDRIWNWQENTWPSVDFSLFPNSKYCRNLHQEYLPIYEKLQHIFSKIITSIYDYQRYVSQCGWKAFRLAVRSIFTYTHKQHRVGKVIFIKSLLLLSCNIG